MRYSVARDGHSYGFEVDGHDRTSRLVIDPFLQSTYLGGSVTETLWGVAVSPINGQVFVAGRTNSSNIPCTAGPPCQAGAQPAHNPDAGNNDAMVARFSADLKTLLQATYIGGNSDDGFLALAIHPTTGEVYVAGYSYSTNFPCATVASGCANGAQAASGGGGPDGIVARLNPTLTSLLQSTYFGGNGADQIMGIAVQPLTGDLIVAGQTQSSALPCTTPATAGCGTGAQQAPAGFNDGFVARINPALTQFVQATFVGGSSPDYLNALALDAGGYVVVAGKTSSSDFPCLTPPSCNTGAMPTKSASTVAFVSRLAPDLRSFSQSTFFGASGAAQDATAFAVVVHPMSGDIYVGGYTNFAALPCVTNSSPGCGIALQSTLHGADDGFIARFSGNLGTLRQATYFGGTASDAISALAVHPVTGEIYATGSSSSLDLPCTTTGGLCAPGAQSAAGGVPNAFMVRASADLTSVMQATYLAGSGDDQAQAIAFQPTSGTLLVAGYTASSDFPCTSAATPGCTAGAVATIAGGYDGFVTRLTADLTAANTTPASIVFTPQTNVTPGTLRESNVVTVSGLTPPWSFYVDGHPTAAWCASLSPSCAGCNYNPIGTAGEVTGSATRYFCLRVVSSTAQDEVTRANLHIGSAVGSFLVTTGTSLGAGGCTLDVDGNNAIDALTDGVLLLRAMFGLTGTSVTNGATAAGAPRTTWAQVRAYLNGNCGAAFAP